MNSQRFLFISFFLEALKPKAVDILDSAIHIADAAVSASARMEVRAAERSVSQDVTTVSSR